MPRYFFHVREGSHLYKDQEGQELSDAEAARREAICSSREMLGERLLHGGSLNHRAIEIADETGHIVDVVNSRDVLFRNGNFRVYSDDVTQSAPTNSPSKSTKAASAPSAAISQRKSSSPAPSRSAAEGRAAPPGWE